MINDPRPKVPGSFLITSPSCLFRAETIVKKTLGWKPGSSALSSLGFARRGRYEK
jgi:hypothetical protein